MSTAEILRKARALIDAPEKWTKEVLARTADGKSVDEYDQNAVCFCSVGAVFKAGSVLSQGATAEARLAFKALEMAIHTPDISYWNDDDKTTHADVLAAFDRAIALAEKEPTP